MKENTLALQLLVSRGFLTSPQIRYEQIMISLAPELALSLVPSITDFCAKPKRKIFPTTWRQPSLASTLCGLYGRNPRNWRVCFIFLQVIFIQRHHARHRLVRSKATAVPNAEHELFAVFNGLLF